MPGILVWAIEGWLRLRQRGRFIQPKAGYQLIEELENLSSPLGAFLRDHCEVGAGFEVKVLDLFCAWEKWCNDVGRKDGGTMQVFGRDLRAAVPTIAARRPREDEDR